MKNWIFILIIMTIMVLSYVFGLHTGYMDGLHDGWWRGNNGQLMY